MYEKKIFVGFSFINYRGKMIFTYKNMWGVWGAKPPQPPEAKNFENRNKTPPQ